MTASAGDARAMASSLPPRVSRESNRLVEAIIDARAARTLPTKRPTPGRHLVATAVEPSVDPALWRLHVRFQLRRLAPDRERLLRHYAPHAKVLARRLYREREPIEDLVQIANEALLLAVDRFDPTMGKPFLAFAKPTIVGTIKRFYRDAGWAIRVPRPIHDLSRPVREVQELLVQDLGRSPSPAEVADVLGVEERRVREALLAGSVRSTQSLDTAPGDEDGSVVLGQIDGGLARVDLRESLRRSVSRLSAADQELIDLYFGQELRQSDIAARLGCSQMQVSRSLRRALRTLRALMPDR
jgi:RNA polymerase sigma-B factor